MIRIGFPAANAAMSSYDSLKLLEALSSVTAKPAATEVAK